MRNPLAEREGCTAPTGLTSFLMNAANPLALFLPAVQEWFRTALGEPTPAQKEGWPAIAAGQNTLILAPTGSGKTLAAFLACLDGLWRGNGPLTPDPSPPEYRGRGEQVSPSPPLRGRGVGGEGVGRGVRVLYISP